jgi:hypothetical protein
VSPGPPPATSTGAAVAEVLALVDFVDIAKNNWLSF